MADRLTDHPYWRVSPKVWEESWSEDGRTLWLYLLTNRHRIAEGLYRLPRGYILADLQWLPQRLAQPLGELLDDGCVKYDETVSVVLLTGALEYQAPANPNSITAAIRKLSEVPPTPLFDDLLASAEQFCQPLAERLRERLPQRLGQRYAQPPAPAPAPIERDICPKAAKVAAPADTDWQKRADEILARTALPLDYQRLGELLAETNKTGQVSMSRVVRELYEPFIEMEDTLGAERMKVGLRAAIARGAPNANYVRKAAEGAGNGSGPTRRLDVNSYDDPITEADREFFNGGLEDDDRGEPA